MYGAMSYVPGEEEFIEEVVEFAYYAAQGRDLWFQLRADDEELDLVLAAKGFEPHGPTERIGEWPPKWFLKKGETTEKKIVEPGSV